MLEDVPILYRTFDLSDNIFVLIFHKISDFVLEEKIHRSSYHVTNQS